MTMIPRFWPLIFIATLISPLANADKLTIDLWVRKAGNYNNGADVPRLAKKTIDLGQLTEPIKLMDFQYKATKEYQGVSLQKLIADYKAAKGLDLALLHFHNGMIIPLPLTASAGKDRDMDIFLATAHKAEGGKWSHSFPEVAKDDPALRDPRPLKFGRNKLVLSSGWHPYVGEESLKGFSPWLYADSLTGIEFVDARAYYAQFDLTSQGTAHQGFETYKKRCQYCHGVRLVGASFGWDYVDPLPIYKQRKPQELVNHVKYPKWDALPRGLMMPAQKGTTSKEIQDLWDWLKLAATKPLQKYKP